MATYRQVCDSRHLQADCQERDQLRNPTLGTRVWATFTFYSAPPDRGEQSIVMSVSVCMSVCRPISVRTFVSGFWNAISKLYQFFLRAQFSSDGAATRFSLVLPDFWMTSCLHIVDRNIRCEKGIYSK